MADISAIMERVDECYEQGRSGDAEQLMVQAIIQATEENDSESLLQLLNELLGHYRETGQVEASYQIAEQAINCAVKMGLEGSVPYATTLLNVANAYRAGGRLEDSLALYGKVRELYGEILTPDNLLVASLENNISLLYQEMGQFRHAKECLEKALSIVEAKKADFEVAVTHANLANTCMELREAEEAYAHAMKAVERFEALNVTDTHYGAALSALGSFYYQEKDYDQAAGYFRRAMEIMEHNLGRNEFYYRLKENLEACRLSGMALCRAYYETYGKTMIEEQFPEYADRIAVGLVGEGSDCYGYDDEISRDHDWGPGFCLWLTEETYEEIGEALQAAYEALPEEFMGYHRNTSGRGRGRRGVMTISNFYRRLLRAENFEEIDFRQLPDYALSAACNGEVFRDEEGIFTAFRERLLMGYPQEILWLKLTESAARFAQAGQYNYQRMKSRKDDVTATVLLGDCLREAMKLVHYVENVYPPHDKWLFKSLQRLQCGPACVELVKNVSSATEQEIPAAIEALGAYLAGVLYEKHFISDTESYLDAHTGELLYKSSLADKSVSELTEMVAQLEFEAFDKVQNEGGRASCQNDWTTFSIMRKSQYLTWNETMLMQYLYDFDRAYRKGHNLITEKYGRMMESTAPEKYEELKKHFAVLSPEKKNIIEQIVQMQVAWMEEFAAQFPGLAGNARSIHTMEDNAYNTSYETYLRGEISTYSDKMLELYGRYVVEHARAGKNLAFEIMQNSVRLYGYKSMEEAEAAHTNLA